MGNPDRRRLGQPTLDDTVLVPALLPPQLGLQRILEGLVVGNANGGRRRTGRHLDGALVPGQTIPLRMQILGARPDRVVDEMLARQWMLDVGRRVGVTPGRAGNRAARPDEWRVLDLGDWIVTQRPVIQQFQLVDALGQIGFVIAVVEQLDQPILQEDELLAHDGTPVTVEVCLIIRIVGMGRGDEADGREVRPLTKRAVFTVARQVRGCGEDRSTAQAVQGC